MFETVTMLEKQGQRKHQQRRENDARHKKRNRQTHIDLNGHGDWWFYQGHYRTWQSIVEEHLEWRVRIWDAYLRDTKRFEESWGDLKESLDKADKWLEEHRKDYFEVYPSEEEARKPYRKYRDDYAPCDRSGRHDARQTIRKKIDLKEMRAYQSEDHGTKCWCLDCQEEFHPVDWELLYEFDLLYYPGKEDDDAYLDLTSDALHKALDESSHVDYYDDAVSSDLTFYDPAECVGDVTTCWCPYCRRVRDERKTKELSLEEKLRPLGKYCQTCHSPIKYGLVCECAKLDFSVIHDPDHFFTEEDLPDALGDC